MVLKPLLGLSVRNPSSPTRRQLVFRPCMSVIRFPVSRCQLRLESRSLSFLLGRPFALPRLAERRRFLLAPQDPRHYFPAEFPTVYCRPIVTAGTQKQKQVRRQTLVIGGEEGRKG